MNNEPVAWISEYGRIFDELPPISDGLIPLYANPVKTLTDEEILSCIDESEPDTADMIRFARAILKKASEK
jgi:hypothetical protein